MVDKKKASEEKGGLCAMAECFPKGEDGRPEQIHEEKLVRGRFEQRLKNDPAFRERFEAGYEEAKSGKGSGYSLEELKELLRKAE